MKGTAIITLWEENTDALNTEEGKYLDIVFKFYPHESFKSVTFEINGKSYRTDKEDFIKLAAMLNV
jgi:hypothetical protein